jgi:hypothetical protein
VGGGGGYSSDTRISQEFRVTNCFDEQNFVLQLISRTFLKALLIDYRHAIHTCICITVNI